MFYRSLTKACMWQNFRWARKETKMKTKQLFSFPPSPLFFLFSFFDRELLWPRSSISIMLKIILRTTHTIFDELLNRSQNKNYLLLQLNTTKTEKRNEKTWCLPWRKKLRKELPRYTKNLSFFIWWFFRLL